MAETAIEPERKRSPNPAPDGTIAATMALPAELLAYVDWRAAHTQGTRDGALAELLAEALRREQDRLLAEGYLSFYGLDERPPEVDDLFVSEASGAALLERVVGGVA